MAGLGGVLTPNFAVMAACSSGVLLWLATVAINGDPNL